MKSFYHLCLLLVLALLASCRPEPQPAHWEVDALVPILRTRLDITDLDRSDTLIQSNLNGQLELVYRNNLLDLKPGEIAPPFNETFSNSAKLDKITLGQRVIQNRISLGMIASQAGLNGALLIAANGTNQVIPPLSNIGPSNFNIDATEYFQSITLRDGWMVLRMENNFPIDLTNLQYSIQNQNSGTSILQNTLALLPAGAIHYDSVHLVNNFLIEGNLVASLVNLDSPGSNGNTVLIDTSDALDLRVTLDKMDPVSATAVFPAQDLFNDTAAASIFPPSALLNAVHVSQGDIFMNAFSTVDDSINLRYALPGAINPSGSILQFLEVIPAAPPNSVVNRYVEIPVQNYLLDLQGMPGDVGVFNTFYTIFTGGIDSTGRIINLSLSDSVYVETGIKNLVTDRGYGFMGYDTLESEEVFEVEGFNDILGGSIDLKQAQIDLSIDNYIGTPFSVQINQLKSLGVDGVVDLRWNQMGFKFSVPPATENQPGSRPNPGQLQISLDENNSNIQDLIEVRPDSFDLKAKAYMNPGVPSSDMSQFLYTNYGIQAYIDMRIPLNLALTDLFLGDTLDFEYLDLDPEQRLTKLNLKVLAKNSYPFNANIELLLFDAARQIVDTLRSADIIAAADLDVNGRSVGEKSSEVIFSLNDLQLDHLKDCKFIFIRSLLNTNRLDGVKFYSDNYLDIQLVGDLSISAE